MPGPPALPGPLVDAAWLRDHLGDDRLRPVDCRWKLGQPGAGEREYAEGHVPGATFMDVDRDLSAPPGPRGRHPLPEPADFERAARAAGIDADSGVVAYDAGGTGGAARLWWLLRHFGHEAVAVLDGGIEGWAESGGPLRAGPKPARPGDFVACPRTDDTIDATGVAEAIEAGSISLVDARAPERYRGEVEPVDSVAGHIPGAANLPAQRIAPGGRFRDEAELRRLLAAAGVTQDRPAAAYCGSGVSACTLVLADAVVRGAGLLLYPGSWSEWSRLGPNQPGDSPPEE